MDSNDDTEENFPTSPLDDPVWYKESISDRELCIYMALNKSETSYPSQTLSLPQKPINEPIPQEETMDITKRVIPDLINIPKEVLFNDTYLLLHWI